LSFNLQENLPEIMADKDQIRQVILNIVLNAADAMPDGGEFKISSRVMEDSMIHLSFQIQDRE